MSETGATAVVKILGILPKLSELQAMRILGIAEGMRMADGNAGAVRDQPDRREGVRT